MTVNRLCSKTALIHYSNSLLAREKQLLISCYSLVIVNSAAAVSAKHLNMQVNP